MLKRSGRGFEAEREGVEAEEEQGEEVPFQNEG